MRLISTSRNNVMHHFIYSMRLLSENRRVKKRIDYGSFMELLIAFAFSTPTLQYSLVLSASR